MGFEGCFSLGEVVDFGKSLLGESKNIQQAKRLAKALSMHDGKMRLLGVKKKVVGSEGVLKETLIKQFNHSLA